MQKLITFLIQNWYLIVIALTVLYQLGKKQRQAAKGSDRTPRMPSFGGAQPPAAARSSSAPSEEGRRTDSGSARAAAASSVPSAERGKASPFGASEGGSEAVQEPAAAEPAGLLAEQPSRQQLLQGVVWAEILGPPRAKKPYRR